MFVDTHIHLTHHLYDGEVPCVNYLDSDEPVVRFSRDELVNYMKNNDFAFCVEPGIEAESNEKILEFSKRYKGFVFTAVGVHPTRTSKAKWNEREKIAELTKSENVIAIGELGLDYHQERLKQHRMIQKKWFVWQLKLADKLKLPLILHIRMANKDAIRILRKNKKLIHGGVCHCFSDGPDIARIYTEEFGFMLGIGGTLLNDFGYKLEETVKEIPLEYLVLETDGPYVRPKQPENISGKKWKKARNTSLIILGVAKQIAEIKCIDVKEVERVTTENAKRLFNVLN